jgi:hypothetical protein
MAHEVPFHRSTRPLSGVPLTKLPPTAVHAVEDVQETSASRPEVVAEVWIDHAVPFQDSASVFHAPELSSYQPTAVHAVLEVQDTPFKELYAAPVGLGVDWMLQPVPFHRIASVKVLEPAS